ncbi:MAG: DUF4278 domain-containing protein [Oscillatoriales cyanobacterium]|nr:MAG: DUF4278 domain-containing protein [Oscillatoriales cyanobacterium]
MKLTYRGANYEYDIPTVDMIEGEVAGKYRGQDWNYRYPRHLAVPKKYGGINILDRRKQVATAKGDERLLRLLEREWQQMAC